MDQVKKILIDRIVHHIVMRDYILYQKGLELREDYFNKLGKYELESFQLGIKADELEYRIMLAKDKLREGKPVELDDLEAEVAAEFKEHHEIFNEMVQNMLVVKGFENQPDYTDSEKSELVRSYGILVRRFYPEFYPKDEIKKSFYKRVLSAYERWNLEALLSMEMDSADVKTEVSLEFEELTYMEDILQQEVDILLQDFPFNLKELLDDEMEVENHREDIRNQTYIALERIRAMRAEAFLLLDPIREILN